MLGARTAYPQLTGQHIPHRGPANPTDRDAIRLGRPFDVLADVVFDIEVCLDVVDRKVRVLSRQL
jgi:hypothetical protein